jgi:hypothetical protein
LLVERNGSKIYNCLSVSCSRTKTFLLLILIARIAHYIISLSSTHQKSILVKRIYWLSAMIILVLACQDDQNILKEDDSVMSQEARVRMLAEGLTCGDAQTFPLMVNATQVGEVTVTVTEGGIDVHYDLSAGEWFLLDAKAFAGDCAEIPNLTTFPYEETFLQNDEIRDFSFSIPWDGLPECGCIYTTATVAKFNAQSVLESYPVSVQTDYCNCAPTPPDSVKCEETLNLPITIDGVQQGNASIEVSEAGLNVKYDLTASEWFLLKLIIQAGECTDSVPSGQTIERLYIQNDEVRLDSALIPADSLPECGCFHSAITIGRFNSSTSQLETIVIDLDANYCLCEKPPGGGNLCTVTQGGWGADPHGQNPGTYLSANFEAAFPNDLVVGCTYTLTFTSAQAITNFLPQGGQAAALTTSYVNPPNIKNVLAGQVVALKLNVTFDAFDESFSESEADLGDAVVQSGTFEGWTVYEVLAEAERALGGCGSQYTFSQLNEALTAINESWDGCVMKTDYIAFE